MKKVLLFLSLYFSMTINGSVNDSLKIINLQREVRTMRSSISQLQQVNDSLRDVYQEQVNGIDSLQELQKKQTTDVEMLAEKVGADLKETNKKIDVSANVAACGIFIAFVLLVIIYLMLRNKIHRGSSSIDKIKVAQESLEAAQKAMQEESVKLDGKLVELLDKQISSVPKTEANPKPDHSFALKVGDEIAKIETNLSKMDPEVKGYRQLKQALKRIKDNFNAHGYEIVELLGLEYNDGMPFEAQFVPDETLPEGKRIISGITRLQINYNGEMIQSAKIVVRQNI